MVAMNGNYDANAHFCAARFVCRFSLLGHSGRGGGCGLIWLLPYMGIMLIPVRLIDRRMNERSRRRPKATWVTVFHITERHIG
jgi:hypothetical protein